MSSSHVLPVGHSSPDGKTVTGLYLHGFDFAHPMLAVQLPGGEPRQHLEHRIGKTTHIQHIVAGLRLHRVVYG